MNTASTKILNRILKLNALAANNPESSEAEAAAREARRLQLAHAVSQADLDAAAQEREDPILKVACYLEGLRLVPREEASRRVGSTRDWKRSLAFAVCQYLGVRGGYRDGTPYFNLFGHLSDTRAVRALYEVCARQIDRECRAHVKARGLYWAGQPTGWYDWGPGPARTEAANFRASAVTGLEAQFRALTQESLASVAAARSDSGAGDAELAEAVEAERAAHGLVLSRKASVDAWVAQHVTFSKATRNLSDGLDFNAEGYTAGKNLKLHADAAIEGSAAKALAAGGLS